MPATILFLLRLRAEVDAKLRERINRRGQLAAFVTEVLETVDLKTVDAIEPVEVRKHPVSTVKLPAKLHGKLKRAAVLRKTSMQALLNGAIVEFTARH